MRVVVIGAGLMGLACALDLLEQGHEVTVVERAESPGGLAGSFDFGGVPTEKFHHFICGADRTYFQWLERLGLSKRLRWRRTTMAIYRDGSLHPFGDPFSLLRFEPMSLPSRLRYGLHVLGAKRLTDWRPLEHVPARDWLVAGAGEEAYRVVWEPLLRQKFREGLESLAAAWIWSRIHRLASSRRALFQEWLGFLDGGTDGLVETLVRAVRERRGTLHCGTPVERLFFVGGRVEGLRFDGRDHPADAVVSTVPLPLLVEIAPDLPESYRDAACDLNTIGVRCLVLKLKRPLSPHFWINVNDDGLFVCGLIEYTDLSAADRFGGHSVLYSPLYAPRSHPEYRRPDEEVYEKTVDAISLVAPRFDRSDVVDYRVFRRRSRSRSVPLASPAASRQSARRYRTWLPRTRRTSCLTTARYRTAGPLPSV